MHLSGFFANTGMPLPSAHPHNDACLSLSCGHFWSGSGFSSLQEVGPERETTSVSSGIGFMINGAHCCGGSPVGTAAACVAVLISSASMGPTT